MKIDILTIFPNMFDSPFAQSIIKRAKEKELIEINIHDLRDWSTDKHNSVDARPFGGGAGMILMVEPIFKAVSDLRDESTKITLMTPKGTKFTQKSAQKLSKLDHIILIAGRYEGFDQRVRDHIADMEISIGDYVLSGGEIPAMVVTDAIVRLIPGVLGNKESTKEESHSKEGYIEYPQYTRPEEFNGWSVPKVLLSGNHAEINNWKKEKTKKR